MRGQCAQYKFGEGEGLHSVVNYFGEQLFGVFAIPGPGQKFQNQL